MELIQIYENWNIPLKEVKLVINGRFWIVMNEWIITGKRSVEMRKKVDEGTTQTMNVENKMKKRTY